MWGVLFTLFRGGGSPGRSVRPRTGAGLRRPRSGGGGRGCRCRGWPVRGGLGAASTPAGSAPRSLRGRGRRRAPGCCRRWSPRPRVRCRMIESVPTMRRFTTSRWSRPIRGVVSAHCGSPGPPPGTARSKPPPPETIRGPSPPGKGLVSERWAGLAPAFPRRKRGVFPWTTNARSFAVCCGELSRSTIPHGAGPRRRHQQQKQKQEQEQEQEQRQVGSESSVGIRHPPQRPPAPRPVTAPRSRCRHRRTPRPSVAPGSRRWW